MTALLPVSRPLQVRKAAPSDVGRIATVLSRAFFDDPVTCWILPDLGRRLRIQPESFDLYTTMYLGYDEVYVDGDGAGAALWAPPGQPPVAEEEAEELVRRLEEIFGVDAARVFELVELFDEHHPHEPHSYLQFMGVEPERQGQGIGSSLLRPVLDRCDRDGLPAYAEATSLRNRRLYERHGFRARAEIAPASGPSLWSMWREPAAR